MTGRPVSCVRVSVDPHCRSYSKRGIYRVLSRKSFGIVVIRMRGSIAHGALQAVSYCCGRWDVPIMLSRDAEDLDDGPPVGATRRL